LQEVFRLLALEVVLFVGAALAVGFNMVNDFPGKPWLTETYITITAHKNNVGTRYPA
jgi:hypothetical protein